MNGKLSRISFVLLSWLAVFSATTPVAAVEAPEIEIADFQVSGDGETQTFIQFLDTQKYEAKEAKHLASSNAKGDIVYSVGIELPPAVLQPSLSLSYSSEGWPNLEMPPHWSLGGILEIRRPLVRAYELKDKNEWYDAEWILSGPISGTLKPSGNDDYVFYLDATLPQFVTAKYDAKYNRWTVHHDGVVYHLDAQDAGAETNSGTALWRVYSASDQKTNHIQYDYDEDGKIQCIWYGDNDEASEGVLTTVGFAYGQNVAKRTSAHAGFLTTHDSHIEKITIQEGNPNGQCTTESNTATTGSGITMKNTANPGTVSGISSGLSGIVYGTDADDEEDSVTKSKQVTAIMAVSPSFICPKNAGSPNTAKRTAPPPRRSNSNMTLTAT